MPRLYFEGILISFRHKPKLSILFSWTVQRRDEPFYTVRHLVLDYFELKYLSNQDSIGDGFYGKLFPDKCTSKLCNIKEFDWRNKNLSRFEGEGQFYKILT